MKEIGFSLKYNIRFLESQTSKFCLEKGCKADKENKVLENASGVKIKEIKKIF